MAPLTLYTAMCNKIYYLTRKEARAQARRFKSLAGRDQHPYYCRFCRGWHLTSMSRVRSKQDTKARRERRDAAAYQE